MVFVAIYQAIAFIFSMIMFFKTTSLSWRIINAVWAILSFFGFFLALALNKGGM